MQDNRFPIPLPYQLLDLLVKLFTVGIFSSTGGAKAWFDLFLVIAALASCGYLIWWQAAFLILILIFGTFAAGLLTLVYPQILTTQQFTSEGFAVSSLNEISRDKIQETSYLSGGALLEYKDILSKAANILEEHPTLLEDLAELKIVLQNVSRSHTITREKIHIEKEEAEEVERRRRADEQERIKRLAISERQRQEAERQEAVRLQRKRREAGFSGGQPPLNYNGIPICPPGYPIKVTLNGTNDGYDGIIWMPDDGKRYNEIHPRWCFRSVQEALMGSGKYRLRRPK